MIWGKYLTKETSQKKLNWCYVLITLILTLHMLLQAAERISDSQIKCLFTTLFNRCVAKAIPIFFLSKLEASICFV